MINEEQMEAIAKRAVYGQSSQCPSCGATLVVKNDFHGQTEQSVNRTFIAKCLNCGEYGEVTYNLKGK